MSQVTIGKRKIYLSPVLDMFDGEIVAYSITESPNMEMITDMLHQLYKVTDIPAGAILHSDQGWHYQHAIYQKSLRRNHIVQSMSRKGNCLDNAMMENFFGVMKSELLYQGNYTSADEFKKDLVEYIDYYNNDRIKLRLGGMSPVKYRLMHTVSNNV